MQSVNNHCRCIIFIKNMCCSVLCGLAGLRPSWRLGWKVLKPAVTSSRRNRMPSQCASVKSFVKLLKSAYSVYFMFSNISVRLNCVNSSITAKLCLFLRLRLRWERWWERRRSLWQKLNLLPVISGKNQRKITWFLLCLLQMDQWFPLLPPWSAQP